jgi:hypothetical protein
MTNHKEVKFTEVELDRGEEQGMAIPSRDDVQAHEKSTPTVEMKPITKVSTAEQRFLMQARELEHRTETYASFVPFMTYWPTYSNMNAQQEFWYFYWRTEVRSGRYPETDLSYIFLHTYELLQGVGWQEPLQGYRYLMDLWTAYQKTYAKLNFYMVDWVSDFVLVHQLDISFQEIMEVSPHGLVGELLDLELMRGFTAMPIELNWDMLEKLSNYNVQQSKFYEAGGKELLPLYAPRVVSLVDGYVSKKHGKRLIEMFHPGEAERRERYLFGSSVYDTSLYGRTISVSAVRVSEYKPLRELMTQLVRLSENILRGLHGFKGKLRSIQVEAEMESLIQRFIEREYHKTAAMQRAREEVVIDPDRLTQLQQDSDIVRELLTVEEALLLEEELTPHDAVVEQVEQVADDEPEAVNNGEPQGEWAQLAAQLEPLHLKVLAALVEGSGYSEVMALANAQGTMPELLLDHINDVAMEVIGDLLIDGETIVEEYIPLIEQMLR